MTQTAFLQAAGPLTERLAQALARVSLALRHHAQRCAAERGLSPTQGEILVWLRAHPGATLSEVARGLAVTAPTASDAVTALLGKRLVRKRRGREDARAVCLELTARGRREAERAAGWPELLAEAAAGLPAAQQQALLTAVIRLIRFLQERGKIPVTRMCVTCTYFRPFVHADEAKPHHCDLVDAAFGDRWLRVDCPDHQPAAEPQAALRWEAHSSLPLSPIQEVSQ